MSIEQRQSSPWLARGSLHIRKDGQVVREVELHFMDGEDQRDAWTVFQEVWECLSTAALHSDRAVGVHFATLVVAAELSIVGTLAPLPAPESGGST